VLSQTKIKKRVSFIGSTSNRISAIAKRKINMGMLGGEAPDC
jgi:hypothetical protein